MKKNRITPFVIALITMASLGVGATMAYFTDSASAENVITMGKVDIDLDEPNFDPDDDDNEITNVVPNQAIVKDPTITVADTSEDCYVRTKIEFSDNLTVEKQAELLENINIDENLWYLSPDGYYYYKNVLSAGQKVVFFDKVVIPEAWDSEMAGASIQLKVSAEAIQADNFKPTMEKETGMITAWLYSDGITAITAETYSAAVE